MTGKSGPWRPRVVVGGPASDRTGKVVHVETGVLLVTVRSGTLRATLGGDLLAAVARDPGAAPRVGDRVRVRCWCDHRVTVEQVVARSVPAAAATEPDDPDDEPDQADQPDR